MIKLNEEVQVLTDTCLYMLDRKGARQNKNKAKASESKS